LQKLWVVSDRPRNRHNPSTSEDLGISIIALIFSGLFKILLNSMTCPKYSIHSWKMVISSTFGDTIQGFSDILLLLRHESWDH
jgi:hypothetical protein